MGLGRETMDGEEEGPNVADALGALGTAGDQLAVAEVDQEPLPLAIQVAETGGGEAKVTVEPAPMKREVRDWLTEENFREEEPVTEMEAGVVKAPERLVVPLVIWREE